MKSIYPRLAFSGIAKNAKTYIPYILTCMGSAMTLYIVLSLASDPGLMKVSNGEVASAFLSVGAIIISIFSCIFLFYTNSFLIKRRKKEYGLYNVLGMGKRHIAKMAVYETLFIAVISIVLGILFGIIFSKLMLLLLLKLLNVPVAFGLNFSPISALITTLVFGGIFVFNLIQNIIRIGVNKTVDLLYGGKKGEREPKTNAPLAILGVLALGAGYVLAMMVKNPAEALLLFFVAVVLVIIGTYAIITAGSTVVLKLLKRNKGYYYKPNHFISVSGMLYRMKQNAAGISTICILSTMVLVTVSTTGSLYFGVDNLVNDRFTRDIYYSKYSSEPIDVEKYRTFFNNLDEEIGIEALDMVQASYNSMAFAKTETGYSSTAMSNEFHYVTIITADEYKNITGEDISLSENEMVITQGEKLFKGDLTIDDKSVTAVSVENYEKLDDAFRYKSTSESHVFVFKDKEAANKILPYEPEAQHYMVGFNVNSPEDVQKALHSMDLLPADEQGSFDIMRKDSTASDLRGMFGSFLFLGMFLGALFLMATVLIMYYKQISEGYDDKQRFEIMEKVGMAQKEIRKTIKSQVLMVFFIPILFAVLHMVFAFKMISAILAGFGLTNIAVLLMYTGGSVVIFGIIYLISYVFTARSYYRIVK